MSADNGNPISNQPSFADRPWVPVLIPLAVVASVGLLAVGLTMLRRRVYRDRAPYLNQQGRQALERDLEERITRGYRRPAVPGPGDAWSRPVAYYSSSGGGSRRARTANRWAWANNLAVSRREEGLNELGEAPPPYAGRSGSAHKDETAIEMGNVRSSGEEDAERASRSAGGRTVTTDMTPATSTGTPATPAPASPPPLGLPPAYSQATRLGTGEGAPITVPAPTVSPPSERRINHLYG